MAVQSVRRTKERLTVSLSRDMREYVAKEAAARGTDQSAVVEDAVRRMFRDERRRIAQADLIANAAFYEELAESFRYADAPLDEFPWEE